MGAAAVVLLACPGRPRALVYDLAERLSVAERWSARDLIVFGTPSAEPGLAEGFYREAAAGDGEGFVWARGEAELSLTWPEPAPRAAVADLAPYSGLRDQSAEVFLNGERVTRLRFNEGRHRYSIPLPKDAQRAGENRLRFVFASVASPSDDGKSADKRQLAAAFYSLVTGGAGDAGLQDLLARDAPRPLTVARSAGVPEIAQAGPSVVRYALRLPDRAELRFTPDLHPRARAAAASATLRVTVEERPGEEKEVWSAPLGPRDRKAEEVRVALPGRSGSIVRLGLHVGGPPEARFLWAVWRAPRVFGVDGEDVSEAVRPKPSPAERQRADDLVSRLRAANVLFVILDAGRADHFGCYGYPRSTTPHIDAIAREGVVFERAFTPAVYTLGAMSSVWTSQYPERHHADVSFSARLPRDRLTLAELLGAQGVHTAGFVSNTVAGAFNGFDRGFAEFHEVWREQATSGADGLGRAVTPWLAARREGRFFAYVHFREPHSPYDPPAPFDTRFGPDGPIPKEARRKPGDLWITDVNQGRRTLTAAEREHLVRLYDGNLAFADEVVGQLRRALEVNGQWDRTAVIVAADHGEALLEHGWIGHNTQVYEESVRIPLVVRLPPAAGLAPGRRSGLVDLLDLGPTIADLFGVLGRGSSGEAFQGRSLLPMLFGDAGLPSVLSRTVWDRPVYARRDEKAKLVHDTRTGRDQLFDLAADPNETRDVGAADPLRAAWARQELQLAVARLARRPEAAAEAPAIITRPQCENLKAMGYLDARAKCPDK